MKCLRFLALVFAAAFAALPAFAAEPGGPAPDFTLNDISGATHSLADSKGKITVLEWTNYDCPFVKKHYGSGNMQALQKEYTAKGVVWYSVNSSAPGKQGNYSGEEWARMAAERNAAPTAILLDPDGKAGNAYGAKTTPHLFLIDAEGKLAYAGAIDDKSGTDPSEIRDAKNYARQALDELLAGKPVSEPSTKSYGCSVKYA